MNFQVRLLAAAQSDLLEIEQYYDAHAARQAARCLTSIVASFDWIAEYAPFPAVMPNGLRFVSTGRFPYYVWCRVDEGAAVVEVLAVLHHRRGDDGLGSLLT